MSRPLVTIDGNEAAAWVAHHTNEVIAIYPITPSSNMGEWADQWSAEGRRNLWGSIPEVAELQSEGGASAAVHGALQTGALTTTFTASQGLLLMIPTMFKIAGELTSTVFHVTARTVATHALSIFGDHGDIMAVRSTGWALLSSNSVQEVMDMALIAQTASLNSRIPFVHFFDGFRVSHEVQKVEQLTPEDMRAMLPEEGIFAHRRRAMNPNKPTLRGTSQNPDVFFQARESANLFYDATPGFVQEAMDKFAGIVGRQYHLFDYVGHPKAERVIVIMGSGAEAAEEYVEYATAKGEKIGLVKVRLFRPFSISHFIGALPTTVKHIAVLDRTKEPGAEGEPLYKDIVSAVAEAVSEGKAPFKDMPRIIGGRYGLSSKEFTPAMVQAIYAELKEAEPKRRFTVGIEDDVSHLSLTYDHAFSVEGDDVFRGLFYGLGADGTVGANKNSIKIIGDNTDMNAQGYFVYDSKKSYGITVSHLRFGKSSVNYPYLIQHADFVACHNPAYIGRYDMLGCIKEGGTFLLTSDIPSDEVFNHLTREMQEIIIQRKIKFYNIDALKISVEAGLGSRINTVMQTAFFKLSGVLEQDKAIELIKSAIKKSFAKKGEDIIKMNCACVDKACAALEQVKIPAAITKSYVFPTLINEAPGCFAKDVMEPVLLLKGDDVPVSKMSFDGVLPTGTSALEKRGIAPRVPHWVKENCIQCNQCVMACPHAVVRAKQMDPKDLTNKPESFCTIKSNTKNDRDLQYKIQVYIEDCTGCGVCVETCPAKTKALEFKTIDEEREAGERKNAEFFEALQDNVLDGAAESTLKGLQFKKPLFEFSGACGGCGETPYVKLVTQLYGEHMMVANATGCSSIYGGTFPAIPYCKSKEGRGPAWGNSLFEDNAEYGLGMRLAVDNNRNMLKIKTARAIELGVDKDLAAAMTKALEAGNTVSDAAVIAQNAVKMLLPGAIKAASGELKEVLAKITELQDFFADKSVWIFGGDGWAYDIGYGGLDHVVASGKNVNILVLDTEVYSNTGGQMSKSTQIGAVAQFAAAGKRTGKKNLSFMCMSYGYVYVASISMGANRMQAQKALMEAAAYNGPSIVIAYAPCIAHGIDMMKTQVEEKRAVDCGYWPLFRFNPAAEEGKRFAWESKPPTGNFQEFIRSERRYSALLKAAPQEAEAIFKQAEEDAKRRMAFMENLGKIM